MRIDKTVPTMMVPTTLKIAAIAVASIDYSKGEKRGTDSAPFNENYLLTTAQLMYINGQLSNVSFT